MSRKQLCFDILHFIIFSSLRKNNKYNILYYPPIPKRDRLYNIITEVIYVLTYSLQKCQI